MFTFGTLRGVEFSQCEIPMTDKNTQHNEPRDTPFDPLRTIRSDATEKLTKAIQALVEGNETRQRARRAKDAAVFTQQIEALVANLIHQYLATPDGWLAITRSKDQLSRASRYRSPVMSKTLPELVDTLHRISLIDYRPGFQSGFSDIANKQSTITASNILRGWIDVMRLGLDHLGYRHEGEVIILKRAREDYFDVTEAIEYDDNSETIIYRQQVQRLNGWLAAADLDFDEFLCDHAVDTANRRLRRVFNLGSFEHGGRLFGGFWQGLTKRQRKEGLLINGNLVTTLDFGQIAPRIMYGMVNTQPNFEDAYLIPGLHNKHRSGVKKVFNAMLHAKERQKRLPHGTRNLIPNKAVKVGHVIGAILECHQPIAHLFYSDQGLRVMFDESQILITIMEKLMDHNIIGLPIHDALIVQEANAPLVREIMITTFKEITGIDIPVGTDDE